MSEINRIASEFLASYLSKNPEAELHRVVCPGKRDNIVDSHESAAEFIHKLQQLHASGDVDSRIEISEPKTLNIVRVVRKGHPIAPAFLAGFRRDGKAVWAYESRFASTISREEVESVIKTLQVQGFEVFVLPAPEPKRSSF